MGFLALDLRFLLSARQLGFQGRSICTLGRQAAYISKRELAKVLNDFNIADYPALPNRSMLFAEDIVTPLGFSVESLDASTYEGASLIHDLNAPLPAELVEKFDLVFDGGSLEHVFNFPLALHSAMKMVKVGGVFMGATPANNQCGHGFYQFSPELFFRVFPANGFEVVRLYITGKGGPYHVVDPVFVHQRVQLLNSEGAMIMVHARKVTPTPETLVAVQQSDYVANWSHPTEDVAKDGWLKAKLRKNLSGEQVARLSRFLNNARAQYGAMRWKLESRLSNRKLYIPVDRWDQPTHEATAHARK